MIKAVIRAALVAAQQAHGPAAADVDRHHGRIGVCASPLRRLGSLIVELVAAMGLATGSAADGPAA